MSAPYDLIADTAATLRMALRDAGAPQSALDALRVMPPHAGPAKLVTNANRLWPDAALWARSPGAPVLEVADLDLPSATVTPTPASMMRALMDLPAHVPPQAFAPCIVSDGIRAASADLARLRIRAALDAAGLDDGPDWPEHAETPAESLPLLRALLGAAREGPRPSASWRMRLLLALQTQWEAGPGPLMRLVDPGQPDLTDVRLALAARGAALL